MARRELLIHSPCDDLVEQQWIMVAHPESRFKVFFSHRY